MRLPTGCRPLDELLGGGLEPGAITLVYGEAGTGKTNLCLQLSREAARGQAGKVGYVDTEGVSLERLEQISGDDYEGILQRILFFAPRTLEEQERMVSNLAKLRNPGLIVVDSLNMHYRLSLVDDDQAAGRSITRQLAILWQLAQDTEAPVLATGQVYGSDESVRPFGGRTMEHIVKAMVRLERDGQGSRRAILQKHRSRPEGTETRFTITQSGLV